MYNSIKEFDYECIQNHTHLILCNVKISSFQKKQSLECVDVFVSKMWIKINLCG